MKNTPTPNPDFEKLLRQQLEQINDTPDDNTWANIAAKQSARNVWLRLRHYAIYAVPVIALAVLSLIAWHYYPSAQEEAPGVKPTETPNTTPSQQPVASIPQSSGQQVLHSSEILPENRFLAENNFRETRYSAKINSVPAATIRFHTETGLDYESPLSGTRVHIPANSLTDAAGVPVQGEVELVFREYRSIPDFLASGIPMHYADERGSFFFNSGGMFDVRVHQQGEPLQMAPGQTYDVTFAPTDRLARASLFYFDDQRQSWEYRPDPAFTAGKETVRLNQPPVVSEAQVRRDNTDNTGPECLPFLPDFPPLHPAADVITAVQMGYDLAFGKEPMHKWFQRNPHLNNEQLLNSMERGLIRIVRDRDRVEQFFPEDVNNVFTELKAFKDCYFICTADTTSSMLKFASGDNTNWQRISVVLEKGNTCLVSLYDGEQGLVQIYADLTGSAGNKSFNANKVMSEYHRLRNERQQNFEKLVTRLRRFLAMADMFQTEQEWCMADETWLDYFEANHPLMRKRYDALVKAGLAANDSLALAAWDAWRKRLRDLHLDRYERGENKVRAAKNPLQYALRLTSFGLYNCDQIFRLSEDDPLDYIYAGYETKEGQRIIPSSVSVMERKARLFFTLQTPDKMLRLPGRRLDIVVTDREGRSYLLPADRYAALSLKNRNSNIFTVEDVTDKTRTPRDWAELLDM